MSTALSRSVVAEAIGTLALVFAGAGAMNPARSAGVAYQFVRGTGSPAAETSA